MHVVQTLGPPPNHGRTYLAMSGCTWNSRNALRKVAEAKTPAIVVAATKGFLITSAPACGAYRAVQQNGRS
jgi:hypothetical protein